MRKQSGMTLLEVLISVAILAMMAYFAGRIVVQALQSKDKAAAHFKKQSALRDSLRIMERDLNMAFNYRDYQTLIYNAAAKEFEEYRKKKAQAKNNPGGSVNGNLPPSAPPTQQPPETPPENAEDAKYKQLAPKPSLTQFIGKSDSVHFAALNYSRVSADELAGDQAEVGYFTETCRDPMTDETSLCLFRRTTPYIDNDVTVGGDPAVLVTNVAKFSLRYLPKNSSEFDKEWDSTGRGRENQKGQFPAAVEIELTLEDPKTKDQTTMKVLAEVRFPNNPPAAQGEKKPGENAKLNEDTPINVPDPNNPNGQNPPPTGGR